MINFWYFVPKSGIAFIFLSVLLISLWNGDKGILPYPYVWIFAAEITLFFLCFLIADHESDAKRKQ